MDTVGSYNKLNIFKKKYLQQIFILWFTLWYFDEHNDLFGIQSNSTKCYKKYY